MPEPAHDCPKCGSTQTSADVKFCCNCRFPLLLIAGKYRLEKKLPQGGFADIYLASHIHHRLKRVIKIIHPEVFQQKRMEERFHREIELTSKLAEQNDHIVRIYDDSGEIPDLGYFYVMEYLQGPTLSKLLSIPRQLPPLEICLHIFTQLCDTMQQAHLEQIIHRDLKPDNLFLIQRPEDSYFLKIIDFGIAKPLYAETSQGLKLTRFAVGTPEYMAPEQIQNQNVDARTDIYAIGIILYEMLTGRPPFAPIESENTTIPDILSAHLLKTPSSLRERRPDRKISPEMEQVVLHSLAKDPQQRFQNLQDFKEAFLEAAVQIPYHKPLSGSFPSLQVLLQEEGYEAELPQTLSFGGIFPPEKLSQNHSVLAPDGQDGVATKTLSPPPLPTLSPPPLPTLLPPPLPTPSPPPLPTNPPQYFSVPPPLIEEESLPPLMMEEDALPGEQQGGETVTAANDPVSAALACIDAVANSASTIPTAPEKTPSAEILEAIPATPESTLTAEMLEPIPVRAKKVFSLTPTFPSKKRAWWLAIPLLMVVAIVVLTIDFVRLRDKDTPLKFLPTVTLDAGITQQPSSRRDVAVAPLDPRPSITRETADAGAEVTDAGAMAQPRVPSSRPVVVAQVPPPIEKKQPSPRPPQRPRKRVRGWVIERLAPTGEKPRKRPVAEREPKLTSAKMRSASCSSVCGDLPGVKIVVQPPTASLRVDPMKAFVSQIEQAYCLCFIDSPLQLQITATGYRPCSLNIHRHRSRLRFKLKKSTETTATTANNYCQR